MGQIETPPQFSSRNVNNSLGDEEEEEEEDDQIKDYSQMYDDDDEDEEDEDAVEQPATDTVRIFQTEGTPFISHANSMSDLSLRGGGFESRGHHHQQIRHQNHQKNVSFAPALPPPVPRTSLPTQSPMILPRLPRSSVCKSGGSSVTGDMSILPTPLVYSRASPVQSLSGDIDEDDEQGLFQDDSGSVASEFSHRGEESRAISPSDLPSSPGEVELSPPRRQQQPRNEQNLSPVLPVSSPLMPPPRPPPRSLSVKDNVTPSSAPKPPPIPPKRIPMKPQMMPVVDITNLPLIPPPPGFEDPVPLSQVNSLSQNNLQGGDSDDDDEDYAILEKCRTLGRSSKSILMKKQKDKVTSSMPSKLNVTSHHPARNVTVDQSKHVLVNHSAIIPKSKGPASNKYLETDIDSFDFSNSVQVPSVALHPPASLSNTMMSNNSNNNNDSDDDDYQLLEKCVTLGRKSESVKAMPPRHRSVVASLSHSLPRPTQV